MNKILFFIIILSLLFPYQSFSMSDKLYNKCLRQNDFKSADEIMTKNWKRLKILLSEDDFKFVLTDQRKWVKNGREKEIEYIKSDYTNINLCSLYAISSYARAILLGHIADFLQENPNYTQNDIDNFIHSLDYVKVLNDVALKVSANNSRNSDHQYNISNKSSQNYSNRSQKDIADIIIDKAKDAAIEKAVDIGVRWLLKKLIK